METNQREEKREVAGDARLGGRAFGGSKQFEFLRPLEENWQTIKNELMRLEEKDYTTNSDKHLYRLKDGWRVFGLYGFGTKMNEDCELCPETTKLIEAIPGITTVGFSRLVSGTHILPHKGFRLSVLRCHLGLVVPEECGIKVSGETAVWEEGRCLVFDDTNMHEAWNYGKSDRIVLLVDFKKDLSKFDLGYFVLRRLIMAKYHLYRWLSRIKPS